MCLDHLQIVLTEGLEIADGRDVAFTLDLKLDHTRTFTHENLHYGEIIQLFSMSSINLFFCPLLLAICKTKAVGHGGS